MISRHYKYEIGRFQQPDPVNGSTENALIWNLYTYVQENPLNYIDPDGTLEVRIEAGVPLNLEFALRDIEAWKNFQEMQILFMFQKNEMIYYLYNENYLGQVTIDYGDNVEVIAKERKFSLRPNYNNGMIGIRKPFIKRWWKNFKTTNEFLPGLLAPWGTTFITTNAFSKAAEMPTLLQWARVGFKGLKVGGIQFNSLGTGTLVGYGIVANWLLVGVSYEVGLAIGSAINVLIFPDLYY